MSSYMNTDQPSSSGGVIVTPGPAVVRITPLGFYLRAKEFADAGELLVAQTGRATPVSAFLCCRASELAFKAFLLARGDSVNRVAQLGHDLAKGLVDAYARGIDAVVDLAAEERNLLLEVNDDYMGHKLAYFDMFHTVTESQRPNLGVL